MRGRIAFVSILGSFVSCFFFLFPVQEPKVSLTASLDGNDWLKWSAESRRVYVGGYLHGYFQGYTDACAAAESISTINQTSACLHSHLTYSKLPETLAGEVTGFYTAYPKHRNLNVLLLVQQFSEEKNRSAATIHELLENNKPL